MSHPRVTIGLCVKNCADTIKQCIESVVSQDYPHDLMEIIVVDGCSKDATLSIVKNVLSSTHLRSKIFFENEGLGKARQIIVNESDGDYIVWVDGDMIIPKEYIRKQVNFMENNRRLGIATSECKVLPYDNIVSKLEGIFRTTANVKWGKLTPKLVGTAGSIYRVNAIKEVGGFDVQMKSGEDKEASYRIRETGWLIQRNVQTFFYEKLKYNLYALFRKYFWYGYGWRSLIDKTGYHRVLIERLPVTGFIEGLTLSKIAYKISGQKIAFMLPLHLIFIRTAWYFGLIKAYMFKKK
jgi:glycosyltransferase involved in cell wall biosynthesis